MPLVAVNQVNHSVDANITCSLSLQDGSFLVKDSKFKVYGETLSCSIVIFNVFSPHDYETIDLYADGPCGSLNHTTFAHPVH